MPVIDLGEKKLITVTGKAGANLGDMRLALARHGLGLVRLAEFHVRDDLHAGRLVAVLEKFRPPAKEPPYLLYQERKQLHPRVRAFIQFMEARF
ncbi:hypothetical protein GTP44_21110 [Duganella sp. FT50W]|uniref:LysR substrate-binding domain-containing protein n=1 Tax=Duganella lactea TaxID=2692173 RepID=A0A6L8MNT8_9BURK|nr:LysR substrate-binding domain-containing protein [Duganella lactea]MYM84439.1 hypothetical protein [Duganella lactea]